MWSSCRVEMIRHKHMIYANKLLILYWIVFPLPKFIDFLTWEDGGLIDWHCNYLLSSSTCPFYAVFFLNNQWGMQFKVFFG